MAAWHRLRRAPPSSKDRGVESRFNEDAVGAGHTRARGATNKTFARFLVIGSRAGAVRV